MRSSIFLFLLTLFLLFHHQTSFAQTASGSITGRVVDKSTQQPVTGATISITGSSAGAVTDTAGSFRITGISFNSYNITISSVGYSAQTLYNIVVNAGNENTLTAELEPQSKTLSEVVVRSNKRSATATSIETPLSVQRLTSEEIKSNPGGNFDISKVIQTLPGVGGGAGGGGFRNDIIIRGGAPNEHVFYLDGIEIPVINHFQTQGSSGGPQGLLNVSFIEDVKLSTSAFDARYDNALSSVFQFKQKNGNPNKVQGNLRLSATELALTGEGPVDKKTTFLVSARRSYLQLLFTLIDLPIRPSYWDFQTKITHRLNARTTLSLIGLGAIDDFRFGTIKDATPDKLYILNSNPFIRQWNYTGGILLKRLINRGFINLAVSRNSFDNRITRYEDNTVQASSALNLQYKSRETENKLRFDVNQTLGEWKLAYGVSAQLAEYLNSTYSVIRKQISDSSGTVIQPGVAYNFTSPLRNFWKAGAFVQTSRRFLGDALGISAGLRSDVNTFTGTGTSLLQTLSPRVSLSYTLAPAWTVNASVGRYYKLLPYTILGFADNSGRLVNKNTRYTRSDHYVTGLEYLPNDGLRFTLEGFYKKYAHEPISLRNGIALANLGSDFSVLGNEPVSTDGKGRAYGFEFFAQKKLARRFFGILSFTYYHSEYTGLNGKYVPSSFDNRTLLSITTGYKAPRNWEIGLKFRYQGGAPYTPYDGVASRANYLSLGQGVLDYARLNNMRLAAFNAADIRIDKKWNFRKLTLDVFIDVSNFYLAKSYTSPSYSFKRTPDNKGFQTTDGQPIRPDGSNAVPLFLDNNDASYTPTLGFIVEF